MIMRSSIQNIKSKYYTDGLDFTDNNAYTTFKYTLICGYIKHRHYERIINNSHLMSITCKYPITNSIDYNYIEPVYPGTKYSSKDIMIVNNIILI